MNRLGDMEEKKINERMAGRKEELMSLFLCIR
jgi:hypothetical protein